MKILTESGTQKVNDLYANLEELQARYQTEINQALQKSESRRTPQEKGWVHANAMVEVCKNFITMVKKYDMGYIYENYNKELKLFEGEFSKFTLFEAVSFLDGNSNGYMPSIFNPLTRDLTLLYNAALASMDLKKDVNTNKILNLLKFISRGEKKIKTWRTQTLLDLSEANIFYNQCVTLLQSGPVLHQVHSGIERTLVEMATKAKAPADFQRVKTYFDIYLLTAMQHAQLEPSFGLNCLSLQYRLNKAMQQNRHYKKSEVTFITSTYTHLEHFLPPSVFVRMQEDLVTEEAAFSEEKNRSVQDLFKDRWDITIEKLDEYAHKMFKSEEKKNLMKSLLGDCRGVVANNRSTTDKVFKLLPLIYRAVDECRILSREDSGSKNECLNLLLLFAQHMMGVINEMHSTTAPTFSTTASLLSRMGSEEGPSLSVAPSDDGMSASEEVCVGKGKEEAVVETPRRAMGRR